MLISVLMDHTVDEWSLNINELISVDKFSRCYRDLVTKHHLVEDPAIRNQINDLLDLKFSTFCENYEKARNLSKRLPRRLKIDGQKANPYREFIYDVSYGKTRKQTTQKVQLQVRDWAKRHVRMRFDTLTLIDANICNISDINKALRTYKRDLRRIADHYILVFERGDKTNRIHFHTLWGYTGHTESPRWSLGKVDKRWVKYLGDGHTPRNECLEKGWTLDNLSHYFCKYITKDKADPAYDGYRFRTGLSRGFGLCEMRSKLKKSTTAQLIRTLQSEHLTILPFQRELRLELARRTNPTTSRLKSLDVTPKGNVFRELLSMAPRRIGRSHKAAMGKGDQFNFHEYLEVNF